MQEKLSLSLGVATSLGAYFLNEFFSLSNRFKNPAFVIVRDDQMGWIQHAIPNIQCTKLGFHTVEALLQFACLRGEVREKSNSLILRHLPGGSQGCFPVPVVQKLHYYHPWRCRFRGKRPDPVCSLYDGGHGETFTQCISEPLLQKTTYLSPPIFRVAQPLSSWSVCSCLLAL